MRPTWHGLPLKTSGRASPLTSLFTAAHDAVARTAGDRMRGRATRSGLTMRSTVVTMTTWADAQPLGLVS